MRWNLAAVKPCAQLVVARKLLCAEGWTLLFHHGTLPAMSLPLAPVAVGLPVLWTRTDTAQALGISLKTLDRLIQSHRLRCIRLGPSTVRFRPEDVLLFLEEAASLEGKGRQ